jgi:chromosomal replication initiator protein
VAAITDTLAERIGQQKYKIWFKNSTRFTLTGGHLKVGVPNFFMATWLENHFLTDITRAAQSVLGTAPKITFAVEAELAGAGHRSEIQPVGVRSRASLTRPAIGLRSGPSPAGALRRPEIRLKFSLDTFVVGPPNELAYSAARAVVREQQSPFNPLFIHGGHGVGKTHLLQGVCSEVSRCRPETNWLYLSAEDFANQFVLALKTKTLEAFRRRMRQTDLLAIDDVHFLASKPSTQEEFLHTFNTISLAGKQVVLVSDAHPKMIAQLSEKLVNRFVSGMVVKIDSPDFQMRREICRRYAKTMMPSAFNGAKSGPGHIAMGKLISAEARAGGGKPDKIPEDVIRFVAEKIRSNVRELEGAMLKLIAFCALQNHTITLAMAEEVLAEHLDRCDPVVHVSEIETVVAAYFSTTPAHIHSSKKDRTVTTARHFTMYLARKHTQLSLSEVGKLMGNKNHATVLMGCRRIEEALDRDADIQWQGPAGNRIVKAKAILTQLEDAVSR